MCPKYTENWFSNSAKLAIWTYTLRKPWTVSNWTLEYIRNITCKSDKTNTINSDDSNLTYNTWFTPNTTDLTCDSACTFIVDWVKQCNKTLAWTNIDLIYFTPYSYTTTNTIKWTNVNNNFLKLFWKNWNKSEIHILIISLIIIEVIDIK